VVSINTKHTNGVILARAIVSQTDFLHPRKQRLFPENQGLFPKKHWVFTKKNSGMVCVAISEFIVL